MNEAECGIYQRLYSTAMVTKFDESARLKGTSAKFKMELQIYFKSKILCMGNIQMG